MEEVQESLPEKKDKVKIAIIGKAPASRMLAPYDDMNWEIWSLSDNYNVLPRWDRWFELHDLDRYKIHYPEYYDWLASQQRGGKPVYVAEERPEEIPAGVALDWLKLSRAYDGYLTNSISWMTIVAIEHIMDVVAKRFRAPRKNLSPSHFQSLGCSIGFWGVDMAQNTEYAHQRPSCEYYAGWVRGLGIEMIVPGECDLLKAARLYAVEANRGLPDRKIRARKEELKQRLMRAQHELKGAQQRAYVKSGAFQELNQMIEGLAQLGISKEVMAQVKQRAENTRNDMENAKFQSDRLTDVCGQLRGALEDLSWVSQWS